MFEITEIMNKNLKFVTIGSDNKVGNIKEKENYER